MVNPRAAVEGLYVAIGLGSFLAYHAWLIFLRGKGWRLRRKSRGVFEAGKLARALFVDAILADPKDAILGVQTIRNGLMACSFMSAISAILLTTCLNVALDQGKIDRINKLAMNDWSLRNLTGTPLTRPSVICLVDALALFASFLGCAQSVRLYVHVGFYLKAIQSKFNKEHNLISPEEPVNMVVRAGMAFTFGLRAFYFFVPVTAWLVGPTPMLLTGVLVTCLLMYLDRYDRQDMLGNLAERLQADAEAGEALRHLTVPLVDMAHNGEAHPPATTGAAGNKNTPEHRPSGVPLLFDD